MDQNLEQTIAVLERTPAALDALLRGLPDEWTRVNKGEGTWSAFDIVVHLIHCEGADWMVRARTILDAQGGEVRQFPPFDRWGEIRESQGQPIGEALDRFARVRAENLRLLRSWDLGQEQMGWRGRHPALGEIALGDLMATWAAHDLNHLHHLARVMAHQYRERVGPFAEYLGVMKCQSHGG
jgi:hypothetical protein